MNSQPRTLRVLCMDDNEMVADAFRRRIDQESDMRWAGVVLTGDHALEQILAAGPDVVLVDIDMPGVDSFDIVRRLAAAAPHVRPVMFSGFLDPDYIERALDCGAWGYLSKNEDVGRLIDGIRRVGRGEIAFSRDAEAVRAMNLR